MDEKTNKTHFSSYHYNEQIEKKEINSYKDYLLNVKGNFCDTVKTTLLYKDMIDSINEISPKLLENTIMPLNIKTVI